MLTTARLKRKRKVRARISGTAARPRVSVFRSARFIYAQAINDERARTLCEAHGKSAKEVGLMLAKKLKAKKISKVAFDRSGYKYHGRVAELATAIREAGVNF